MSELVKPFPGGEKTGQTAVTDLTVFPPLAAAYVGPASDNANSAGWEKIEEFDLEISCGGAETFAGLRVLGLRQESGTIADSDFTTTHAAETLTDTAHGLNTGDGPVQLTTSGTLPAGFELATDYWIIKVDANTMQLAASIEDAFAGTAVAITDDGTGTHTMVDTADTQLVKHYMYGEIGPAADGDLVLLANERYAVRILHRPVVIAYALVCTTHTNSTATSVNLVPVRRGYS